MRTCVSTQTYIDEPRVVSLLEVVQHRGLVQAGELRHVLHLTELGWVHLLDVILVHGDLLTGVGQLDHALVAALLLHAAGLEAQALRGHPYQLLGGPVGLRQRVVDHVAVHVQELVCGGHGGC